MKIYTKRNLISFLLIGALCLSFLPSCKKKKDSIPTPTTTTSSDVILTDIATNVIYGVNLDIYLKTTSLDSAMQVFAASPTATSLSAVKTAWYAARKRYELSEAVVFGPSVYLGIDPNLDTWPIDTTGANSIISGSDALTAGYAANLDPTLKGYHIMEFLLFGKTGQKTSAQFSARQLEYLTAISADAKTNAQLLKTTWNPAEQNYVSDFTYAGTSGKSAYASQKAAFQEIVGSMQGIADQVANEKIQGAMSPSPDPTMQESPFSNNTIVDFTNNIQGIKNVYYGQYNTVQGPGVHDWVVSRNPTLDSTIAAQLNASLTSLAAITCTFTDAIYSSSPCNVQLKAAQTNINTLNLTLKNQLIPFINQTVEN